MEHHYKIKYKRLYLRPLASEDVENLRVLRNENREYFDDSSIISPERQKAWFQRYLQDENDIMFAIELLDQPGEFIGAIALYKINMLAKTAKWGRTLIDKKKAPQKGLGTEANIAVGCIAFHQLGLKKISGEFLKFNEAARKMDTRAGAIIIGEDDRHWLVEITPDTLCVNQANYMGREKDVHS